MRPRLLLAPLALLAASLVGTGCDAIAEKLGIDKVTVPLSSIGSNLAVSSTTASIRSGTVTRGGSDLPDVFTVKSIALDPSDMTFTASTMAKVAQSGTVRAALIVNTCVAVMADVTVSNNAVTAVSPLPIQVGSVNMTNFQALVLKLPAAQRPSVSAACTPSGLAASLTATSFSGSIVAAVLSGDLNGVFGIQEGTFNLDF